MSGQPRLPTLFPYTTLFRSGSGPVSSLTSRHAPSSAQCATGEYRGTVAAIRAAAPASRHCSARSSTPRRTADTPAALRSEEHTSELQSRLHLVCRLLLEKKK